MKKDDFIKAINEHLNGVSKKIMLDQANNYFLAESYCLPHHNYKIGDSVYLKKGTLIHGTYKNFEGLEKIVSDGLISSWFTLDTRSSKYPSSVGVWNLKKDYLLKDYVDFYSGGTIRYFNQQDSNKETGVISYKEMPKLMKKISSKGYLAWTMEQTKEARFLPSLVQNKVQIGIIINGNNKYVKKLLRGDILNYKNINDIDVKDFVNENYYSQFIIERKKRDDFFTDRESAILFGIPSCMIEGILVGRKYEKNINILKKIKSLLPNSYICNLNGKVIM